jgi:hypothetical protein
MADSVEKLCFLGEAKFQLRSKACSLIWIRGDAT